MMWLARVRARRPAWPVVVLSAAAWVAVALHAGAVPPSLDPAGHAAGDGPASAHEDGHGERHGDGHPAPTRGAGPDGPDGPEHRGHHPGPAPRDQAGAGAGESPVADGRRQGGPEGGLAGTLGPGAAALGGWALMAVAMMTPAALPMARHVGFRSIRRRRHWAVALFVTAYLAVWAAFGVPALALVAGVRTLGVGDGMVLAAALLAAAAWELSPWKRRALSGCHRTVALPPAGWRADAACLRSGLLRAGPCVVSCGGLMVAMAALGHAGAVAVVVMAGISALSVRQARLDRSRPVRRRSAVLVATALALAAPVAAVGL